MIQARIGEYTDFNGDIRINEDIRALSGEAGEAGEAADAIINDIVANVVRTHEIPHSTRRIPQNEDKYVTYPSKIYHEKINITKLKYIVDNYPKFKKAIEAEELCMRRLDKKQSKNYTYSNLKKLLNACKVPAELDGTEYGILEVSYNKGRNSGDIGRWYAKDGLGLQPLVSCVRHTICEGLWIDIDQVNSHPTLLQAMFSKNGIISPMLNGCVANRDEFLKKIDKNRGTAKNLVISVINGGSAKYNPFLQAFAEDIKNGINKVCNLPEYQYINKYCKELYKDSDNINGKIISRILQIQEDALLQAYQRWCYDNKYINLDTNEISLIFDGFQIPKSCNVTDEDLIKLRKYAYEKTGYDIELKIKPFDNGLELPSDYNELSIQNYYKSRFINKGKELADDEFFYDKYILPCIHTKCSNLSLGQLIHQIFQNTIYYDDSLGKDGGGKWFYYDKYNVWREASNIDFFKYTVQTLICSIFERCNEKVESKLTELIPSQKTNNDEKSALNIRKKQVTALQNVEIKKFDAIEAKRLKAQQKNISVTDTNTTITPNEYIRSSAIDDEFNAIADAYRKLNNDVLDEILALESIRFKTFQASVVAQKIQSVNNAIDSIRSQFQYSGFYTDVLDKNGYLFAFTDKVQDLKTGERRPIKITDYIMNTCGYPSPTTIDKRSNDILEKYFNQIFPDDDNRNYLLDATASMVCGEKIEQYGIFHTGSGSNSKSTYFAMLSMALGGYWEWVQPEVLTKAKKGANDTCSLHNIKGKRGIGLNEPADDDKIQVANYKRLVDNSRCTIKSRALYSEAIEFIITWTLNLLCNNKPLLSSCDDGTGRRIRVVDWRMKFVDNPDPNNKYQALKDINFMNDITSENVRNAFIEFLLNRWQTRVYTMKSIPVPKDVTKASQSYVTESNVVLGFLLEHYDFTNDSKDKIKSSDIFTHYNQFSSEDKISSSKFKNELLAIGKGIGSKRFKNGVFFTGIKRRVFIDDNSDDEAEEYN